MRRRELILYATPIGPLADACRRYDEAARRLGPTAAQAYPPHCTLTGFFRREPARADEIIGEIGARLAALGPPPTDAIDVRRLAVNDRWVGLELESPWLLELTVRLFADHRLDPDDDPIRRKDWLHLSLAYGVEELTAYGRLARSLVESIPPSGWSVDLWERGADGSWTVPTRL